MQLTGEMYEGKGEVENQAVVSRKRRDTQDRDERLRRGRMKIEYKKQQEAIRKKFAKKIDFSEFLMSHDGDEGEQNQKDESGKTSKRQKRAPYVKSNKSVYERFQSLVNKSINNDYDDDDSENSLKQDDQMRNDSNDIDKRNIPEVVDQRKKEKKSFFDADELVSDHGEGEEGEDEEYNDHEYDNNDHTTVPDNFHWFFNPTSLTSHESDNSNKKTKYTKEVIPSSGDKVYHFIHPSLVLPTNINTLADLPTLPKQWNSRSSIELPPAGKISRKLFCLFVFIMYLFTLFVYIYVYICIYV